MDTPRILWEAPSPPPARGVAFGDYLVAEQRAETRSEWIDGTVRAMAGASPRHLLAASALGSLAPDRLRGGSCVFLGSDVQFWIPNQKAYTYPDGAIACPPHFDPHLRTGALTNPRVIFEILSPSTEAYDRGAKFRRYRSIETLEDYVLLSTAEPVVEVFSRPEWGPKTYEGLDAVALVPSVGIELPLRDLYALALSVPE